MTRIAICGVHLTPALALIEELEKRKDARIIFFGRKYATEGAKNYSVEYRIIQKKKNITFALITTGRLQRKFTKYTIPSFFKIPIGFIQSFAYLVKYRPGLIVSFGGYLSLPVVFSGWLLGIDSIVHEQSLVPGLANKINSLFAQKIFLAWPATLQYFSKEKSQVVGNLTRLSIFNKKTANRKIQKFLAKVGRLIYITGGNQGSHFLNRQITNLLPKLEKYLIFHQVGTVNFQGDLDKAKKIERDNYFAVDYLKPNEIGAVLNRADLVIARSGANTVWDLAVLAKVAILIPLPISASREQDANAKILKEAGSVVVISQNQCGPESLLNLINKVFRNRDKFEQRAGAFAKTLPMQATKKIKKYIGQG